MSKVYFTDFRTKVGISIPEKLKRLMKEAGFETLPLDHKYVVIKMHFGEFGNLTYLRPQYPRAVGEYVKKLGGFPFLSDCNTLYPGFRKNALDHLKCAAMDGFTRDSTGMEILIGDGLKGTDEVDVPVEGAKYCPVAHIGRAIMDADVYISLAHFKGHEEAGFGGALKNTGMGCGSRAGKMDQHSSGKPRVDLDKCRGCHMCAKECGSDAITYPDGGKAHIDLEACKGCGRCIGACPFDAISPLSYSANEILGCKIAEYSKAVVSGRPCFYINIINNVSPNCDCHAENDAAIIPDVGMAASFDPVALDQACLDLCNAAESFRNSQVGDRYAKGAEHTGNLFKDNNPEVDDDSALRHGEEIGLGSRKYELIRIK